MKQRVSFEVAGDRVLGDLYVPSGSGPHPTVVVAGPMTSVKEQVTGVYASALAVRGIAALAIDHRHYGESGGAPRQYESWTHKVEDLRAALAWLARRSGDVEVPLGLVGICLGVGYAVVASLDEPRVRSIGAVVGYYRDPVAMEAADPEGFRAKLDAGRRARELYEATGEVVTIPAVGLEGDAAMTTPDTFDYYGTKRGAVPNYVNAFAVMSREPFLPFDVQAAAPRLRAPIAMIHSERALSPAWARRFHDQVRTEKSLTWLASRGHTDFYDAPELVAQATDRIAAHLRETMAS
ncbi:MAG: alpha/beta hydrolase [Deltaproteobacteria bacterium]|nr:alpha/beta hydrolase [Deltaproteobacteria bacterium]